jgi:hypothetical protein
MKITELLNESYGGSESKYPYGRGIMRGDVIKSKKTGETRTVTAVEGSKLLLDNGKQITPFNDWVILKKSSAK